MIKKTILVIWLFLGICFLSTEVQADHLLINSGDQLIWGNIYPHSDRVDIGDGTIEGLKYDVTPPSSSAVSPCSCKSTNQPMPHGTKILVSKKDGTKTWEWIASEGNDMPIDFYNWWQNSGPGKDFAEYNLSNFGLGEAISVKLVGNSSYGYDDIVRIGFEVSSSNMDQLKTLYLFFSSTNPAYARCDNSYLTIDDCFENEVPLINEMFPLSFLNLNCQGEVPCLFEFPASALGSGDYTIKVGIGGLEGAEACSQPLTFKIEEAKEINTEEKSEAVQEETENTAKEAVIQTDSQKSSFDGNWKGTATSERPGEYCAGSADINIQISNNQISGTAVDSYGENYNISGSINANGEVKGVAYGDVGTKVPFSGNVNSSANVITIKWEDNYNCYGTFNLYKY